MTKIFFPQEKHDRHELISIMFEALNEAASDLAPSELDWTIKFEDHFKKYGDLTDRQFDILEDIVDKCSGRQSR